VNQGRTSGDNVRVAPEDRVAPADRPELEEESFDDGESALSPPYPARLTVKVTREGQKGAMLVEAVAQDGDILIENVYYFSSAEHADPATGEAEWQRKGVYAGPPFGNLDEDLQVLLERYLEERGINTQMALFVPDYIDFKEQKEYIRWLESKYCITFIGRTLNLTRHRYEGLPCLNQDPIPKHCNIESSKRRSSGSPHVFTKFLTSPLPTGGPIVAPVRITRRSL
jgi:Mitochondrial glycoprotein